MTDRRFNGVVSDLLGDSMILRLSHLVANPRRRQARQLAPTRPYWPLTPSRGVSAGRRRPIDDVDVTNAAMQVIPGSHHHAQPAFRDSTATENNVLMQTVDNGGDDSDAPVAPEFRAGEISLHSDRILHGSEPNRSRRRRCGPAMRHLPADARAYAGWDTNALSYRRTDAGGHRAKHHRPHGEATSTPPPTCTQSQSSPILAVPSSRVPISPMLPSTTQGTRCPDRVDHHRHPTPPPLLPAHRRRSAGPGPVASSPPPERAMLSTCQRSMPRPVAPMR